jgi:hypothetical protein
MSWAYNQAIIEKDGRPVIYPRDGNWDPAPPLMGLTSAGDILPLAITPDGKLIVGGIAVSGDIEIGAVELKDWESETRVRVADDNGENAVYVQSKSLALNSSLVTIDQTLTDGSQKTQIVDGSGNGITSTAEVAGIRSLDVNIKSNFLVQLDATDTPLAGNASYTGPSVNVTKYARIVGIVFTNKAGNLYIDQSYDNSNWDYSSNFAIAANKGLGYSVETIAPYARLRIVNGPAAQTILRAYMGGRAI